ncbi:hypothetical protein [Neoaquamicrobium sediminum]|uniref:hypothetical protein n=1 Tax=Neoaquamicrobium sediminum TaxID=1849104 RepID=UPI003622F968
MSRYRKIDTRMWNDEKFRTLSDRGKLLFVMLLTHPNMTALGAMRATPAGLAEELGWEPKAFAEAFGEVLSKGMAKHDPAAHFVALPNFVKYNQPENPNVVKAWVGCLDLIPECGMKTQVVQGALAALEGKSKAFAEAFHKAFGKDFGEGARKGMPKQEQEQEPKQEPHSAGLGGERLATPHARETAIPFVNSKLEAGRWLADHGVIPGDRTFDDLVDKMMRGELCWPDIERAAA